VVYHILSYLPARDLKTIRLVNRLLAQLGQKNTFWSDLCRIKWSEKLCIETIPVPSPHIPQRNDYDDCDMTDIEDVTEPSSPITLESHLLSMQCFEDHTYDELVPKSLFELVSFFPAFNLVEGSWLRAYNLVDQHMEIPYLHSTVRSDYFSISDTQWELYVSFLFYLVKG
jgi:hypothetical protein